VTGDKHFHLFLAFWQTPSESSAAEQSTYLGHVELHSTQRYLTMTPELLGEANRRFERYVCGGSDE